MIFNYFFVKQCSFLENDTVSPASFPRTSLIPEGTEIDPRKILELTQRLDSDKAHGCDDVCDEAIVLP